MRRWKKTYFPADDVNGDPPPGRLEVAVEDTLRTVSNGRSNVRALTDEEGGNQQRLDAPHRTMTCQVHQVIPQEQRSKPVYSEITSPVAPLKHQAGRSLGQSQTRRPIRTGRNEFLRRGVATVQIIRPVSGATRRPGKTGAL